MTEFRGTIELFVDESVYPFAVELARELDDSGALFNADETPLQDPPIRLCLSIIANNSEGLQRLIDANVSKVGWSIMFPEPDPRPGFVFRAEDGSSAWVEQQGRMGDDGVVYTVKDEDAQSYRVYLDGQPCVLQPEEAEDDGHVLVTFPRHQVTDYPVKRTELVPRRLRSTFQSPYEQYGHRIGQRFTLVRPCTEEDGFDAETLPAYLIRFEDGVEIHAWPEEVDMGEIWQPTHADTPREPSIVSWSDNPYIPIETFGLTRIDAERLLRFAAAAAEAGILDEDAAWKCGFDTNPDGEISNTVVDVARRAAAFIKERGL